MSTQRQRESLERLMADHETEPKEWAEDNDDSIAEFASNVGSRQRRILHGIIWPVTCFILLIAGCAFGFICGRIFPQQHTALAEHNIYSKYTYKQSPAFAAIAAEPPVISPTVHIGPDNPYSGLPNEVSNAHWEKLLLGYNIRVHKSWLTHDLQPSIEIADGSGDVWATMSVHHHLHCLDSIRHQLGGTGCTSWDSKVDKDGFPQHLDHCLEALRQWVMCQPDLSLRSVYWNEGGLSAHANATITHQCVNWPVLQNWIDDHTIPKGGMGLVLKPDGKPFDALMQPPPRCARTKTDKTSANPTG